MPCDTRLKARQTISQRVDEVKKAVMALDARLKKRQVKVRVGPQGAIAFEGWPVDERDGVTDACAYRQIMVRGSSLAKAEIERAAQLAGVTLNSKLIAQGVHSHDGGQTWHGRG